ncbi:hypothetical protein QYF36_007299 [Acer negundo]|nr:hypothetical protein QYF36_007299 [Acer negundo]
MFSTKEIPSASSLFATYASMTASVMLVRTVVNDLVPSPLRVYAHSAFRHFFKIRSVDLPDRRSGDELQRFDDHFQSKAPGTRSGDKAESSGAKGQFNAQLTLSGLLNFIDGLCLYGEIESLIETTEVTPAQVAGELMKSEDADVALGELVNLLKRKKLEGDGVVDEAAGTTTTNQEVGIKKLAKRQKTENTKPRKYNGRKRTTRKKL